MIRAASSISGFVVPKSFVSIYASLPPPPAAMLPAFSEILHLFGLIAGYQSVNYLVYFSVKKTVQLVYSHPDAVIGNSALREILCPYPLAPVARTNLASPFCGDLVILFFELHVVKPGAEDFKCLFLVRCV